MVGDREWLCTCAGPSLPTPDLRSPDMMSTDRERREEITWLLFHELPDSSDSDQWKTKTLRQTNFRLPLERKRRRERHGRTAASVCVCFGEPSGALNRLTGLEGPVRKHGEHISCYMALPGLLLRASHSFAFMEGYSCLTGITIERLYSRVASARCAILCCFSGLSLWNSLWECLTTAYVCGGAIT